MEGGRVWKYEKLLKYEMEMTLYLFGHNLVSGKIVVRLAWKNT